MLKCASANIISWAPRLQGLFSHDPYLFIHLLPQETYRRKSPQGDHLEVREVGLPQFMDFSCQVGERVTSKGSALSQCSQSI